MTRKKAKEIPERTLPFTPRRLPLGKRALFWSKCKKFKSVCPETGIAERNRSSAFRKKTARNKKSHALCGVVGKHRRLPAFLLCKIQNRKRFAESFSRGRFFRRRGGTGAGDFFHTAINAVRLKKKRAEERAGVGDRPHR